MEFIPDGLLLSIIWCCNCWCAMREWGISEEEGFRLGSEGRSIEGRVRDGG